MKNKKPQIQHLDPRLIFRIKIYSIIALLMLIIIIYEVLFGAVSPVYAVSGILFGLFIGIIVTRMYRLSWDVETSKIISQMDWIGAAILVLYLIFILTRAKYLGNWVQGVPLLTIILSLTAGTMIGRVMGTEHDIRKIFKAWNVNLG